MGDFREKLRKIITKTVVWVVAVLIYGAMVLFDGFPPFFVIGMIIWLFFGIWIHRPESFRTAPCNYMAEAIIEVDDLIEQTGETLSPVERLELIQKSFDKKIGGGE